MMNEINNFYIAKTLRMMNYLAKKFDCIKVQKDNNNENFSVFIFKDSLELREYLRGYGK